MKIQTTRFGNIEIGEENVIQMPFGMLGFPDKKCFVIIRHGQDSPFLWYQSVEEPELAFVIASPWIFMPDYKVNLEDVLEQMSWKNGGGNKLELYVVINVPKDSPEKMTANLVGPVLVNTETKQAVQVVVTNSQYSHKHRLLGGDN